MGCRGVITVLCPLFALDSSSTIAFSHMGTKRLGGVVLGHTLNLGVTNNKPVDYESIHFYLV